jgi:shikimate dehydrogenase
MADRYAVIGNPIAQARSPRIHGLFAQATRQAIEFGRIECSDAEFAGTVRAFAASGGRGMSVTAPFKIRAFELADAASARATSAGAVNALKFDAGRILAENFDGIGLVNDIRRNLGVTLAGRRVLVLGAGGAARGALLPLLAERPAQLVVANRTLARAQELQRAFAAHGPVRGCAPAALADAGFDVVINATSASLQDVPPDVPASVFAGADLAYELVYGKGLTPFLRAARAAGVARLADGVGMVVEQGAEAFLWWRGVRPETGPVIAALRTPLD